MIVMFAVGLHLGVCMGTFLGVLMANHEPRFTRWRDIPRIAGQIRRRFFP